MDESLGTIAGRLVALFILTYSLLLLIYMGLPYLKANLINATGTPVSEPEMKAVKKMTVLVPLLAAVPGMERNFSLAEQVSVDEARPCSAIGKNTLVQVILHAVLFWFVGYLGAKLGLAYSVLLVPLALVFTTSRLIANVLLVPVREDPPSLLLILAVQFVVVYVTSAIVRYAHRE